MAYIKSKDLARTLQGIRDDIALRNYSEYDHTKDAINTALVSYTEELARGLGLDIDKTCLECEKPLERGRCRNVNCIKCF